MFYQRYVKSKFYSSKIDEIPINVYRIFSCREKALNDLSLLGFEIVNYINNKKDNTIFKKLVEGIMSHIKIASIKTIVEQI